MKLYVEIYFSVSGPNVLEVIKTVKDLGFEPVMGEYDFVQEYDSPEEYKNMVEELKRSLRGTEARFRLVTRKE